MSVWICKDVKCKFSGRDKYDGYPVCKYPGARNHCDDLADEDLVDRCCYSAQLGMVSCPRDLWRFSGDRRVPVNQSLLIEYTTVDHEGGQE